MNKNDEAQFAFNLLIKMAELEKILWDRYHEQFMDLLIENHGKNHQSPQKTH